MWDAIDLNKKLVAAAHRMGIPECALYMSCSRMV